MVKRVWTEEQKEDIINSFMEGATLKDLQKRYKAHAYTILKVLRDNNIDTHKKRRWTEKQKEDIIRKFTQENKTIGDLQKEYITHQREIVKILKEHGIDTSYYQRRMVNRNIKIDFFEVIDTEEKAYILGLLMADGCVRKKSGSYYLSLGLIDLDIIKKIQTILNSNSKISTTEPNEKNNRINNLYTFHIFSNTFCRHLLKYGIIPNKTYNTNHLTDLVPDNLMRHYLRGLFDGDGSIGCYNTRYYITLTSYHPSFLSDVSQRVHDLTGIKKRNVSTTSTTPRIVYTDSNALKLIKFLYQDNSISIQRKQKLADQALEDIV